MILSSDDARLEAKKPLTWFLRYCMEIETLKANEINVDCVCDCDFTQNISSESLCFSQVKGNISIFYVLAQSLLFIGFKEGEFFVYIYWNDSFIKVCIYL